MSSRQDYRDNESSITSIEDFTWLPSRTSSEQLKTELPIRSAVGSTTTTTTMSRVACIIFSNKKFIAKLLYVEKTFFGWGGGLDHGGGSKEGGSVSIYVLCPKVKPVTLLLSPEPKPSIIAVTTPGFSAAYFQRSLHFFFVLSHFLFCRTDHLGFWRWKGDSVGKW